MAVGYANLSKFAIVKGATWGTAVLPAASNRYPVKSSSLKWDRDQVNDDSIVGDAERGSPSAASDKVEGSVVVVGDYRQHGLQAALFMGAAGAPTLIETGVYKHVLPWTADTSGKFATAGLDWGGKKVHVFKSVKATRWSFQSRAGGYVEEAYEYLGRGMDDSQASSGWTYLYTPLGSGNARKILHRQLVMRANARSAGALGSPDLAYPTSVEVIANRALEMDFAQQGDPEEPIPGDFAEISLALTFFGADTGLYTLWREAFENETDIKADLVYTDTVLLGSTKFRERSLYFPSLRVISVPTDLPGPGRVPFTVRCTAHRAPSLPTGFPTGYDEALTQEAQFELATDLLA